ncbi:UNVERIFIED_CONTAM: hypothetical protein HDU68_005118, partial [Siphonaria sp. JEL0065]
MLWPWIRLTQQTTFFPYKDFWALDLKTYSWEKLEVRKKPSPRSMSLLSCQPQSQPNSHKHQATSQIQHYDKDDDDEDDEEDDDKEDDGDSDEDSGKVDEPDGGATVEEVSDEEDNKP